MFRKLRADEIDIRVAMCREKGVSLLLYKDARCDMNILDETVGPFNWQRHHERNNANCIVSIWDSEKEEWIEKEDTGTESNTEKEKGLASDSFKRACFNWGIGRELYTSPFIWVQASDCDVKERNGRWQCNTKFKVGNIEYNDSGEIDVLTIMANNKVVFSYRRPKNTEKLTMKDVATLEDLLSEANKDRNDILKFYRIKTLSDLKKHDFEKLTHKLNAIIENNRG